MANEVPHSSTRTGLARTVLEYGEGFQDVIGKVKQPGFSDADWAALEALVDTENFERVGQFLTAEAEVIDWATYKSTIVRYGGSTSWEGTLRGLTESGNKVIQELEERNTRDGVTDVSNTVTVFRFNDSGKLDHLECYVMPLEKRPA